MAGLESRARADMGADVGMAVPTLLTMQHDADPEVRRLVRRALAYADERLDGLLAEERQAPDDAPFDPLLDPLSS